MKKICLTVCLLVMIVLAGCKSEEVLSGSFPEDFNLIVDARSNEYPDDHIYMVINADGVLKYARYNTGGSIEYDLYGMILEPGEEALERGLFNLNAEKMDALWNLIREEKLLTLDGDYRMEIGDKYAFIAVTGEDQTNVIDNIGMNLPEAETLINQINSYLPSVVWLTY